MFSRLHRRRSNLQDLRRWSKSCPAVDSPAHSDSDTSFESVSTASIGESSEEAAPPVSPAEQRLARKSVRRAKQREDQHQRNMEENKISMDDYLGKQAEFRMWLQEEQKKHDKVLSSPKRKTYFKMFVRLWNKRHLPAKYYEKRTSKLMEDTLGTTAVDMMPSPLTARPPLFQLMQDSPLLDPSIFPHCVDLSSDSMAATPSPFSTFGKLGPSSTLSPAFSFGRNSAKRKTPGGRAATGTMRTASISPQKKMAAGHGRPAALALAQIRSSRSDLKVTPVDSPRCPGDFTPDQPEQDLAFPHYYYETLNRFSPDYAELQCADDSAVNYTPGKSIKSLTKSPGHLNRRRSRSMDDIPTYAVPVRSSRERASETETVSEEEEDVSDSPPPLPPKLFKPHEFWPQAIEKRNAAEKPQDTARPETEGLIHSNNQVDDLKGKSHESLPSQPGEASCSETKMGDSSGKSSKKLFKAHLPWLKKLSARRRSRSCEELSPRVPPSAKAAPLQEDKKKEDTAQDFPLLKLDGSPTLGRRANFRAGRQNAPESNSGGQNSKQLVPQTSSTPAETAEKNNPPQLLPAIVSKMRQSMRHRSCSVEQTASPSACKPSPWYLQPDATYFRWPSPAENLQQTPDVHAAGRAKTLPNSFMMRSGLASSPSPSVHGSHTTMLGEPNMPKPPQGVSDERVEDPMEVDQLDSSPTRLGNQSRQAGNRAAEESCFPRPDHNQPGDCGDELKKQVSHSAAVPPVKSVPSVFQPVLSPQKQFSTFSAQHSFSRRNSEADSPQKKSSHSASILSLKPFSPSDGSASASSCPPAVSKFSHQVQSTTKLLPTLKSPHCLPTEAQSQSTPGSAVACLFPSQNVLRKVRKEMPRSTNLGKTVSKIGTPVLIEQLSSSPRQPGKMKAPANKPQSPAANMTQSLQMESQSDDKGEMEGKVPYSEALPLLVSDSNDLTACSTRGQDKAAQTSSMSRKGSSSAPQSKQSFPEPAQHGTSMETPPAVCTPAAAPRPLPALPAKAAEPKPVAVPSSVTIMRVPSETVCATAVPERLQPNTVTRLQRRRSRSVDGGSYTSKAFISLSHYSNPSASSPGRHISVQGSQDQQCENLKREPARSGEVVHSISQVHATLWQPQHNTWMAAKEDAPSKQAPQGPGQMTYSQRAVETAQQEVPSASSRSWTNAPQGMVAKPAPLQQTEVESEKRMKTEIPYCSNRTQGQTEQESSTQNDSTLTRHLLAKITRQSSRRRSRSVGDVPTQQEGSSSQISTSKEGASFSSLKAFWDHQRTGAGSPVRRNFSISRPCEPSRDKPGQVSQHPSSPKTPTHQQGRERTAESSGLEMNGINGDQLPICLSPFITVRRNSSLRSRNGHGGPPSGSSQEQVLTVLSEGSASTQQLQASSSILPNSKSGLSQPNSAGDSPDADAQEHTFSAASTDERRPVVMEKEPHVQEAASEMSKQKPKPVPPPKPKKPQVSALQNSLPQGKEDTLLPVCNQGGGGIGREVDLPSEADSSSTARLDVGKSAPSKRCSSRQATPTSTPAKRLSSGRHTPLASPSWRRVSGVKKPAVSSPSVKRQSSGKGKMATLLKRQSSEMDCVEKTAARKKSEESECTPTVIRQHSVRQMAKAWNSLKRTSSGRNGTSSPSVTRQNSARGTSATSTPVARHESNREAKMNAATSAKQGIATQDSTLTPGRKQITQRQTTTKSTVRRQSSGKRSLTNSPQVTGQNKSSRKAASNVGPVTRETFCEELKIVTSLRRFNSAREESSRSPYVPRNNSARESSRRSYNGKRRSDEGDRPGQARRSHSRGDYLDTGKVRRTSSGRRGKKSSDISQDSHASHSDRERTPSGGGSFRRKVKPPQSPTFMRITRHLHALDNSVKEDSFDENEECSTGSSGGGEQLKLAKLHHQGLVGGGSPDELETDIDTCTEESGVDKDVESQHQRPTHTAVTML